MRNTLRTAIVAVPLFLMQPSLAEEFDNIRDMQACRAIPADAERLLCYDTVADGGIFNEQKVQEVQARKFGDTQERNEVTIDKLTVTIERVQESSAGIHYFYTDDGAVWKQSTGRSWNIRTPFRAEIKAGKLGSYFLVAEGGKSTRVKRVK